MPLAPNPAATGGDLTQVCQAPNVQPHSPLQQKSLSLSKKLDQIQGLVGADNREIEDAPAAASFPSSAIVHINSSLNSCTGFIYAPDMVVTAGHCVFERDFEEIPNNKQWATGIVVSPGRTNTVCPYGSCTASRLYTTRGWAEEKNDEFDYGAIKLDCSVGYKTGWLGLDWNGLTASSNLTLIGYRGLSDPMKPRSQLTMTAPPSKLETRIVYYEHDTLPGDSGAPLFTGDMIARVIHGTSCHLGESDSALNLPHPVDELAKKRASPLAPAVLNRAQRRLRRTRDNPWVICTAALRWCSLPRAASRNRSRRGTRRMRPRHWPPRTGGGTAMAAPRRAR